MKGMKPCNDEEARSQTLARLAPQDNFLLKQPSYSLRKTALAVKKFLEYRIPSPGEGCHPALLGKANLGVLAGLTPDQVADYIRQSIPNGKRHIPDREIQVAVDKAFADAGKKTGHAYTKTMPAVKNGSVALRRIIEKARYHNEAELSGMSEIRIDWLPEEDAAHFIESLFPSNVLLFIGDRHEKGIIGRNIRTAAEWIKFFRNGHKAGPFIIINPLSGELAPTRTGDKTTYRGDLCIQSYLHCLAEFDNLSREDQFAFWSVVKLPIKALVDTGGKSVHAWLDVTKLAEVSTADDWDRHIKKRLYNEILIPMGVDRACKNPARLSRLPGCFRTEKGKMQQLLWLSPEGRQVAQ